MATEFLAEQLAAVALLRPAAAALGIPATLVVAGAWQESGLRLTPPRGDGGMAAGLLQMRVDVWGGPPERWEGAEGARRALAAIAPRWRARWHPGYAQQWETARPETRALVLPTLWCTLHGCDPTAWTPARARMAVAIASQLVEAAAMQIEIARAHPDNYARGRGGVVPEALVLHTMDGSEAAARAWFQTPPGQRPPGVGPTSAHYGVTRAGRVVCYVAPEDTAYANGALRPGWEGRPAAPLIRDNIAAGAPNPNSWTIAIEHEGRPDDDPPLTPAQFDASVALAAYVWRQFIAPHAHATGARIERGRILRHSDFDPIDRARCPGWPSPLMERYIAALRARVEAPVPPASPVPDAGGPAPAILPALDAAIADSRRLTAALEAVMTRLRLSPPEE